MCAVLRDVRHQKSSVPLPVLSRPLAVSSNVTSGKNALSLPESIRHDEKGMQGLLHSLGNSPSEEAGHYSSNEIHVISTNFDDPKDPVR